MVEGRFKVTKPKDPAVKAAEAKAAADKAAPPAPVAAASAAAAAAAPGAAEEATAPAAAEGKKGNEKEGKEAKYNIAEEKKGKSAEKPAELSRNPMVPPSRQASSASSVGALFDRFVGCSAYCDPSIAKQTCLKQVPTPSCRFDRHISTAYSVRRGEKGG